MWVSVEGEGVCVCLRASAGSSAGQARNVFGKGTEGMCSERYKGGMCSKRAEGRSVFGKGHRKGCVPFLMRVGTRKGTEGKVFANMSAPVDTFANAFPPFLARSH